MTIYPHHPELAYWRMTLWCIEPFAITSVAVRKLTTTYRLIEIILEYAKNTMLQLNKMQIKNDKPKRNMRNQYIKHKSRHQ
jgi:hypothetical protein